jgi:hypothetical protein
MVAGADRDEDPAITTSKMTTITTLLTTFYPHFCNPKIAPAAPQTQKLSAQKPKSILRKPEIHHNSPQMPRSSLIHT